MPTVDNAFYFGTVDDDQSGGTVVKKLTESTDPPAANSATTATWTTTAAQTRTLIPLAGNTTNSDTTNVNGWSFNNGGADGLGSVVGALRVIPGGQWAFTANVTLNTPALLATIACTLTARVYRVAAGGGARSLLFTAAGTNFSASGQLTWFSTVQPDYVLAPGEVIQVGYTAVSAATAAAALGAITNTVLTLRLGVNWTTVQTPQPGVRTRYAQPVFGTMRGFSWVVRQNQKIITSRLVGVPTIPRKIGHIMELARMDGVPTLTFKITAARTLAARMAGIPSITRKVGKNVFARMVGADAVIRKTVKIIPTVRMAGVPTLSRRITAFRLMSARLAGVSSLVRKVKKPLSTRMAGAPTLTRKTGKRLFPVMLGRASRRTKVFKNVFARMDGVPTITRKLPRLLSVRMDGVPTIVPKIRAARTLSAKMIGRARMFVKIDTTILSRITGGGGGTTIVKKVINYLFDD